MLERSYYIRLKKNFYTMYIWGMLCFSDIRYILKPESVTANNFPILSQTLTLGITKYQPDIEYPI